eukprot:TRINITY_DN4293_c0_g1_i2.p1 TRINITY_DN4293_c0_g1~~TRINITY_DN4293_c0_g1_i2.p1  ORF type:complete len:324 (+),score=73.42 TRINITY_DN4293_c0_g1_i2:250-1221(+)
MSAEKKDRMGGCGGEDDNDEELGLLTYSHRSYEAITLTTQSAGSTITQDGDALLHFVPEAQQSLQSQQQVGVIRFALSGVRKNAVPGVVIQALALVVVLGYYYAPPITAGFNQIAGLKSQMGFFYAAISTMLFGGFLPWLVVTLQDCRSSLANGQPLPKWTTVLGDGAFLCLLFIERGVEVDAFYKLQAYVFGSGADLTTIAWKVLVDEFVYSPFWATPFYIVAFGLKDCGYNPRVLVSTWDWTAARFKYVSSLLSTWLIWLPVCTLVYALPGALQVPLFNLVLCFYTLLLVFINKNNNNTQQHEQQPQQQHDEQHEQQPCRA